MPFREKAKSLLRGGRRHGKTSDGDSLSKTSTKNSGSNRSSGGEGDGSPARWPDNVYKPGEAMPRPKYRATPAKAHTERLNAFSFADAWRSKSFQSQYSPMGTRAPSRRNSAAAGGGASSRLHSRRNSVFSLGGVGRRSSVAASSDGPLTESVTSADTVDAKDGAGVVGAAKPPRLSTEVERESEEDEEKEETDRRLAGSTGGQQRPRAGLHRQVSTARDHQPFTEQDLSMALHRSHLAVPARS